MSVRKVGDKYCCSEGDRTRLDRIIPNQNHENELPPYVCGNSSGKTTIKPTDFINASRDPSIVYGESDIIFEGYGNTAIQENCLRTRLVILSDGTIYDMEIVTDEEDVD